MLSKVAPFAATTLLLGFAACSDDVASTEGSGGGTSTSTSSSSTSASTSGSTSSSSVSTGMGGAGGVEPCGDTNIPEENLGNGDDPEAGEFTLEEALDGLPEGPGPLRAIFDTTMGEITCELFPDIAPIGVANFVGLARGRRPFEDGSSWIKGRRFYDGLTFHRVIDNFMAQGGDPQGNGFGDPGYEFVNEIAGESHTPGTLSYANSGPDTNGSQFFIVAEEPQTHLDKGYTIFGRCTPVSVVTAITEVDTDGNDEPVEPILMNKVSITRCAP